MSKRTFFGIVLCFSFAINAADTDCAMPSAIEGKSFFSDRTGTVRVLPDGSITVSRQSPSEEIVVFKDGKKVKEYDFGLRSVAVALTHGVEEFANGCTARRVEKNAEELQRSHLNQHWDVTVEDDEGTVLAEWNFGPEYVELKWRAYKRTSCDGRYEISYSVGPERPHTIIRDIQENRERDISTIGSADFTPDGSQLVANCRGAIRFYNVEDFFKSESPIVKAAKQ